MAHLTKPTKYNIEDSNIALLGSDLEKHVREAGGGREHAWTNAGQSTGLEIWRIEKFHVVSWPKERYGTFYDGDSYIVLHTYKATPDAQSLSYDLHFWLGQETTQDEAGTAAYKTVELDDHLHGKPVEYREVQGFESPRFISYFPRFITLQGGVSTGFHHVAEPPPLNIRKLYRISLSRGASGKRKPNNIVVREVPCKAESLVEGDAYVLDKGAEMILQLNAKGSSGQERYKAAGFCQSFVDSRQGQATVTVYDEGDSRAVIFLNEFGDGTKLQKAAQESSPTEQNLETSLVLFRISDESGRVVFQEVDSPSRQSLNTNDAFLVDLSFHQDHAAIYVWIGDEASLQERRRSIQLAQQYLYDKREKTGSGLVKVQIPVIKVHEGDEPDGFFEAFS